MFYKSVSSKSFLEMSYYLIKLKAQCEGESKVKPEYLGLRSDSDKE